ncbi:MAG: MBOAT family protein [Bacteroidetes bacterium]|nr:MAG: MBOAT family protein [Bacteroidota bacterium]
MQQLSDFLNFHLNYHQGQPLVFTSVLFFAIFSIFYSIYAFAYPYIRLRNFLLLAFSLYFYFKISGFYVILLILMATSDYLIGWAIHFTKNENKKQAWAILSVLINIGSLFFFKYTNFLLDTYFGFFTNQQAYELDLLMPLGISFYVFKTLSYIFDLQREVIELERNYFDYLLYVSFFPNILAGPISKAKVLLPQFKEVKPITEENISKGFFLIVSGAFKKIVIADYLAVNLVDRVFGSPTVFTGLENLMATYGAMMQLYYDFSGYVDLVMGMAFLLGFSIEDNFNKPFHSQNITELWRRWHMSLSNWLNDYLYYPLAFEFRKLKKWGVSMAVFITFLISGLWHGANFTYIIWGALHGLVLCYEIMTQNFRKKMAQIIPKPIYVFFSVFLTLHFLVISIIIFKVENLSAAWIMYEMIFTQTDFSLFSQWIAVYPTVFGVLILAYILAFLPKNMTLGLQNIFASLHWTLKTLVLFIGIVLIYQVFSSDAQPFVYLEF